MLGFCALLAVCSSDSRAVNFAEGRQRGLPGRCVDEPGGDTTRTKAKRGKAHQLGRELTGENELPDLQRDAAHGSVQVVASTEVMTFHYKTEWRSYDLLRRIKPASSSMAIAANAAAPVNPFTAGQPATLLTWDARRRLGMDMGMAFDGTGRLGETVLTRAAAGRYKLHTVEAALAQVLELETTDCRRSALERGFCPAPASESGPALVTLRSTPPVG